MDFPFKNQTINAVLTECSDAATILHMRIPQYHWMVTILILSTSAYRYSHQQ